MNIYYLNMLDKGYNVKTSPILNRFIKKFIPIDIDENNDINNIKKKFDNYNKLNNIIIFYQHKSISKFKNNFVKYLNNLKKVYFKVYLFTFDFWHASGREQFLAKNYKVITFARNIKQLNFFQKTNLLKYQKNFIFCNIWCSYNESFLDFNKNPINKLLISGATNSNNYPERFQLKNLSENNKYLKYAGKNKNDILSSDFMYNKRLNSYFACFSTSVYVFKKNTNAILLKTFEILGSGSLLVMPSKEEKYLKEIGLENMKNCYLIDFNKDLNIQIKFLFDNLELFNKIRKAGQDHSKKYLNEKIKIDKIKKLILN